MTWAWGIDVRTELIAIGAVAGDGEIRHVSIDCRTGCKGYERLHLIREIVRTAAIELPAPTVVVVEDPKVVTHNYALIGVSVVTGEALWARGIRCPIFELQVPKWKVRALGRGNAPKEFMMRRAREMGYEGDEQDVADALCIALAGHDLLRGVAA